MLLSRVLPLVGVLTVAVSEPLIGKRFLFIPLFLLGNPITIAAFTLILRLSCLSSSMLHPVYGKNGADARLGHKTVSLIKSTKGYTPWCRALFLVLT